MTKDRLRRTAEERRETEKIPEINRTGIYKEWNKTYGEGIAEGINSDEVRNLLNQANMVMRDFYELCFTESPTPDSFLIVAESNESAYVT
jgi:hypothetical protein